MSRGQAAVSTGVLAVGQGTQSVPVSQAALLTGALTTGQAAQSGLALDLRASSAGALTSGQVVPSSEWLLFDGLLGQHVDGGLHQQTGGDEVSQSVSESLVLAPLVSRKRHSVESDPHCREGQYVGRRVVERLGESGGMGAEPKVGRLAVPCKDSAVDRHVCGSRQREASDFLHSGVSPKCMGCRCFGDIVGQSRFLCVSPDLPCSSGVTKDQVLPVSSPSDRFLGGLDVRGFRSCFTFW